MKQRVLAHKKALVLQTIWEVSDYSDMSVSKPAKIAHNQAEIRLVKRLRTEGCDGFIVGASGCALCAPCAQICGEPCRFPDYQYSCMSALLYFRQETGRCLRYGIQLRRWIAGILWNVCV